MIEARLRAFSRPGRRLKVEGAAEATPIGSPPAMRRASRISSVVGAWEERRLGYARRDRPCGKYLQLT